jgi:hypothetical protein
MRKQVWALGAGIPVGAEVLLGDPRGRKRSRCGLQRGHTTFSSTNRTSVVLGAGVCLWL